MTFRLFVPASIKIYSQSKEMKMWLKNAMIFRGKEGFVHGSLRIAEDTIQEVTNDVPPDQGTDLEGKRVLPGLVDIHIHGSVGCDFSDGEADGLNSIGRYLAANGITSFAPASMTLPYEQLEKAFTTAKTYREQWNEDEGKARLAGINMEGPWFSPARKGAQNPDFLRLPDYEAFSRLNERSGGLVRLVDVAPELEGALDFIRRASKICRVSLAHTDAAYEEAVRAFECGASHVTHLFNAMPPVHHRKPGVIGAACERKDIFAELICDGEHIHPSIVRMAFRLFPGRICLISDALRCCGMRDGEYELGGQKVFLKDRVARLEDGTIAGAASNLYEDMMNAIRFGIPMEDAILSATLNPARQIGMDQVIGSIEPGKKADLVVCDENWVRKEVLLGGKRVVKP